MPRKFCDPRKLLRGHALGWSLFLALLAGPAAAGEGRARDTLVGHYYLSGVMETGSELLLRGDGTFEWTVAYGSIDAAATGHWTSDGRQVTLTARNEAPASIHFQVGEKGEWNDRVTHFLEHRREQEGLERRAKLCPLPALDEDVIPDGGLVEYGDMVPPAGEIARLEKQASVQRDAAQRALDRLKGDAGWASDEALAFETDQAIRAYHSKLAIVRGLHERVKAKEAAEPVPLALPDECRLADFEAEAKAFHGAAVHVYDRQRDLRGDGIRIEAHYDKGPPVSDVVVQGYAYFPIVAGQRLTSITLTAPGATTGSTLPVSLTASTLQLVDADLDGFTPPPFTKLALSVRPDGSLGAEALFRRGAYVRAAYAPPGVPVDAGGKP